MLKNIILYLLSIAVMLSAYLFTHKWVLFILFCVVVFTPLVSIIISLPYMIATIKSEILIYSDKKVNVGDPLLLNILGSNKIFFSNIRLNVVTTNKFAKFVKADKLKLIGNMRKPISKSLKINAECGCYSLYVNSIRVYDLLGIISFNVKVKNSFLTLVVPTERQLLEYEDVNTFFLNNENGELDTDYFNFTEYHYGLNARDINWKLSARKNTLIARKYETYVEPVKNVYLDLTDDYKKNESIVARFVFLAYRLIEENSYCITSTKKLCMKISSENSLDKFLLYLFTDKEYREFDEIGTVAFTINSNGEEVKTIE